MSPKKIAPVDIEGIEHVSAPANRVLAQVAQSIASRKEQDGVTPLAGELRRSALGFLHTARQRKKWGVAYPDDIERLVSNARWHWRRYLQEIQP